MGNCDCLINLQEVGNFQTTDLNCDANAWASCGFAPAPMLGDASPQSPYPTDAGLGGTASVTGPMAFQGTANGYSIDGDQLTVTLAQNGRCGALNATGPYVIIGIENENGIGVGNYDASAMAVTLDAWDDAAGLHGMVGASASGTVTISSMEGGLLSGSLDVTLTLADGGAVVPMHATFDSMPACSN